jgi:chaperonin cofactor prefoldin
MTRLHTAARRLCAGPTPLQVLTLLALLALSGCGGGAMKASAPSSPGYAGEARYRAETTGAGAEAPMEPEAAPEPTLTGSAESADEEALDRAPAPRPMAQAEPPPPRDSGGAAPPKRNSDATTPPPVQHTQPGVDTGSARPPEAAAMASPLLIYRANLNMAVFETKKALDRTEQIAEDAGGYLVRRDDRSITVRVPAARFQGALASMMKLGDVLHRAVSVEDVTAQYRDLQIRLKNAEAVRDRLAALLKKAQSVKDALQVERELARVTDEIESMKGKLKLLHELVQFSTITIQFSAQSTEHVDSTVNLPFPWLRNLGLGKLLRL